MTAQRDDDEPLQDENRRLKAQLFALRHSLKLVQHELEQYEALAARERAMRMQGREES